MGVKFEVLVVGMGCRDRREEIGLFWMVTFRGS